MAPILMLEGLCRSVPIAEIMLDDLQRAATFLDELGASQDVGLDDAQEARGHAGRLWAATQALERMTLEIRQAINEEQLRRRAHYES